MRRYQLAGGSYATEAEVGAMVRALLPTATVTPRPHRPPHPLGFLAKFADGSWCNVRVKRGCN